MRNPIIDEIRRIRAKMDGKRAQNPNRDYVAESHELLLKVCDIVVSENGERRYVTNWNKMYEVLIAPRLAMETAHSKSRVRRRPLAGRAPRAKNATHESG